MGCDSVVVLVVLLNPSKPSHLRKMLLDLIHMPAQKEVKIGILAFELLAEEPLSRRAGLGALLGVFLSIPIAVRVKI